MFGQGEANSSAGASGGGGGELNGTGGGLSGGWMCCHMLDVGHTWS